MPRLSARVHLLGLIAAAVIPVWVFAAYLLAQFALNEQVRFKEDAQQVARQVSLVVEGELAKLLTVLEGLSKSAALAADNFVTLHGEAVSLTQGTERTISLRTLAGEQILNSQTPYGSPLPAAEPVSESEAVKLQAGRAVVSRVYTSPISKAVRFAVLLPVKSQLRGDLLLAISVPTSSVRDALMPAAPEAWVIGVGDSDGAYVARSHKHEEFSGLPGLPEYIANIVGPSGTFTSRNFQGGTLLAGYYRSQFSGWFYTANIPLTVVQAPLWRSIAAICAIGLLAMLVSLVLAYVVGKRFAGAARELAARAEALGHRKSVPEMPTSVDEFATIAQALHSAERTLSEREHELEAVLETAPVAVWFTYDPDALQVIRNRFAAELMGLSTEERKTFGAPDLVIDTKALKDGQTVSRRDRPLSKAMRGELTDNEEFSYYLPSGGERYLLSSARPIRDAQNTIIGAVQISLDITDRKRNEEQRKLLVHELNHRVKNTLAVVQSIATQTLRHSTDLDEAGSTLGSRLMSLARAHDILTQENWSGADLKELIKACISPHSTQDRFTLSGDAVHLFPNLALSLVLAIHELTTNAIKYGALSNDTGTVSIVWTVNSHAEGRILKIEWRERGGPPVVDSGRKGFGTRMLERVLGQESGTVSISFEESGVVCLIEADLTSN